MIYNIREDVLKVQDIKMNYITFGKGKRPLIMIQGLNTRSIKGAGFSLAYMYRIFAKEYKVYLFDRRENVGEHVTVKELAEDVALAMDTLGITNADIFGVSQGGMIAQYLAIERPDLVHKMVLAVTLSKNNDMVKTVVHDWIRMIEQEDMKTFVADMAGKMYTDSYVRRYRPFMPLLEIMQKPKDAARFITLAKACLTCDTYDSLEKIHCPVLVIGGEQDKIVGGDASREIADRLGCDIYMYEGLGHAAYEEAKDFNQIVYEFLMK